MTNFLEIAKRNAARGFRVIPLHGKEAFLRNWPQLATTDDTCIREWAAKFRDYNCGVAGGSDVIILDSDRVSRLKELSGEHCAEWFNTYAVSSGRPDRAHFYFRATPEAVDFGNKKWKEPEVDGHVFEMKGKGAQVTAEGSVHPVTGGTYAVIQDMPLIPFPDGLLAMLRLIHGKANPSGKREWALPVHDGEGRDDFLTQQAGRLRSVGADEETILFHIQKLNSDPSVIADPKSDEDLERIARSVARYNVPTPDPVVTIGSPKAKPEPAKVAERTRPVYPIAAWEGTAVGTFAQLCGQDNNIPMKMYAEAFRCVLGAVVGDRLSCPGVDGAVPRTYTVIVAPKGKGKGTAIRRAVRFFNQSCDGWSGNGSGSGVRVSFSHGLLSGERDFEWKPKGIGAWMAAASSVPGMARLCRDLDSTGKNKPQLTWGNTLPRILSVHEEMKTFLSTLFIEGGVGSGMEGVVCQLWDDVTFHGTATGTREAAYGEMMFSMLCGVTEQDWFDLLSRGNAVGSGLMSRFNIIGTEGGFENVSKMKPPDFTQLQTTFLPRVMQLEDAHARLVPTEAADRIISEWADNLPDGSERMNVHAWRSALLIAWLRHEDTISAKTAQDAVMLGQYQIASHEYYRTKSADTANARVQAKLVRILEMKGPMSKRELQRLTHAHRDGTELWNRALDGLVRDRAIGKREDGAFYRAE
jgi:phage terminase Nu1 subunit (DNA packaging protein)